MAASVVSPHEVTARISTEAVNAKRGHTAIISVLKRVTTQWCLAAQAFNQRILVVVSKIFGRPSIFQSAFSPFAKSWLILGE